MDNIITLESDRPRPLRSLIAPKDGARILFFTGVRYCRFEDDELVEPAPRLACFAEGAASLDSGVALDLAAH